MHDYTIDANERRTIIIGLSLLGIFAAYAFSWLTHHISVSVPWWLDAPAAFGFASIFYGIFDRAAWRLPLFQKIGLVTIPDLGGTWQGQLKSSFSEIEHPFLVEIEQTWTKILVKAETAGSRSLSLTACIGKDGGQSELAYTYRNEPKAHSAETMNIHYGTTVLRLHKSTGELIGEYYTGRGRQTFGSMRLKRAFDDSALPLATSEAT